MKSLLNYGNKLSVIQQNRLFETNLVKDNLETIQKRPQPDESSNKSWQKIARIEIDDVQSNETKHKELKFGR